MSAASKLKARPREALNIRIRAEERGLIDRAAAMRGTNRTDFILDAARRAVEKALLDQSLDTSLLDPTILMVTLADLRAVSP
jgi:uncharacterized protein (DUF1778 family)